MLRKMKANITGTNVHGKNAAASLFAKKKSIVEGTDKFAHAAYFVSTTKTNMRKDNSSDK